MKKLIILLSTILYSCTPVPDKPNIEYYNHGDYVIIEADSCEYIKLANGKDSWGSHRGNCKYCKLRNKK